MISTHELSIGYDHTPIQEHINLKAEKGQLICLIGTNGAGKSTLLRTLAGLQPALFGHVEIGGKILDQFSIKEKAKQFAVVLTDKIQVQHITLFDLVGMGRMPYSGWSGSLNKTDRESIKHALAQVNLQHKMYSKLEECSDGEKQRAIIAMALAQDTPLVMLDEPTSHLDLPNRIEIMLLLRKLSSTTQKTFILSTHELDLSLQLADKMWLMTPGKIEIGFPEDLMLRGLFQKTFGNKHFVFDDLNGHSKVVFPLKTVPYILQGDHIKKQWLIKAFNRLGYQPLYALSQEERPLEQSPIEPQNIDSTETTTQKPSTTLQTETIVIGPQGYEWHDTLYSSIETLINALPLQNKY